MCLTGFPPKDTLCSFVVLSIYGALTLDWLES